MGKPLQDVPNVARPIAGLDVAQLRLAIQEEYETVATKPEQGFHFHTGLPLARLLGYDERWLEGIPEPTGGARQLQRIVRRSTQLRCAVSKDVREVIKKLATNLPRTRTPSLG